MTPCAVPECERPRRGRQDLCATHVESRRRGHPLRPLDVPPLRDRVEECYDVTPSGCWEWNRQRGKDGYGRIAGTGGSCLAHRHVYELHRPPIPQGLQLDHLCRNRACVNPEHLEPVTPAENTRRGLSPTVLVSVSDRCGAGLHPWPECAYTHPKTGLRQCQPCAAARTARRRALTGRR